MCCRPWESRLLVQKSSNRGRIRTLFYQHYYREDEAVLFWVLLLFRRSFFVRLRAPMTAYAYTSKCMHYSHITCFYFYYSDTELILMLLLALMCSLGVLASVFWEKSVARGTLVFCCFCRPPNHSLAIIMHWFDGCITIDRFQYDIETPSNHQRILLWCLTTINMNFVRMNGISRLWEPGRRSTGSLSITPNTFVV